ncbi:MAG: radical SAM protein [Armatimonadota bacterium]
MAAHATSSERCLLPPTTGPYDLSVVVAFPNTYHVGMSSLSLQAVYGLVAGIEGVRVERAFVPDDATGPGAKGDARWASLESGTPLRDFDVVALSVSFELDYLNVLALLDRGGISLLTRERTESHPVVIAGGAAITANPAPLADFVDACLIGEAEEALPQVIDVLRSARGRAEALPALAAMDGMWVPSVNREGPVRRLAVADLARFETASVFLTPHTEFGDCFLVEVGRGCGRACRFCLASHIYRPLRQRSVESLVATAARGLRHTDRIGLLGASLSDYRDIDQLATELADRGARLSTSSLRIESVSQPLLRALSAGGQKQITLAPEAASARLRELIRKGTTDQQLFSVVAGALAAGLSAVKLYFMIGLPTETDEEAREIAGLVARLEQAFPEARFTVSVAPFVPKAHTPFQWAPMAPQAMLEARTRDVKAALQRHARASVSSESPRWAVVQGILSRGGAELGPVLLHCYRNGGTTGAFRQGLRAHGLEPDAYLAPDQHADAPLPWDFIAGAEDKATLWRQWQQVTGR